MAHMINGDGFEKAVLKSEKPVMVDFFAKWCGPCQMIAPVVEQLSEELEGRAEVFKADIDDDLNEELCEKYEISAVPTLLFFKDGRCMKKIEGAVNKSAMEKELAALI